MLLFTAVLSIIALILLVFRPAWGVLMVFIARPFVDTTWDSQVLAGLKLTEIFSAGVPLILFMHLCFPGARVRSLGRMPLRGIWIAWTAYVAFFSSCILYAEGLTEGFNVFFRHVNGLIGFFMVQAWFAEGEKPRRFLWALAIAGMFPMAQGLIEHLTGVHWKLTQGEGGVIRNIGLYHDAITIRYYALQTLMGLLLLAVLYFNRQTLLRILALGYGLICTAVVQGAYSKSGALTLAFWAMLWPTLLRKYKTLAVMAVLGAVVAAYYAPDILKSIELLFNKEIGAVTGEHGVDRAFNGRWYTWQELLAEWQRLDIFAQIFGAGRTAAGAHNDYLQVLFHGGIVGLGFYIALLATLMTRVLRDLWRRADPWSVAALMVMIMWLIDAIGLVPSAYPGYQWFAWGIVGLCLRRREDALHAELLTEPSVSDVHRIPVNGLQTG